MFPPLSFCADTFFFFSRGAQKQPRGQMEWVDGGKPWRKTGDKYYNTRQLMKTIAGTTTAVVIDGVLAPCLPQRMLQIACLPRIF